MNQIEADKAFAVHNPDVKFFVWGIREIKQGSYIQDACACVSEEDLKSEVAGFYKYKIWECLIKK